MAKYKLCVVEYHDLEVSSEALVTVTEAARMLDMSKPGVIRVIERGALSEVIDIEGGYRGRRLLRDEVEKMASAGSRGAGGVRARKVRGQASLPRAAADLVG